MTSKLPFRQIPTPLSMGVEGLGMVLKPAGISFSDMALWTDRCMNQYQKTSPNADKVGFGARKYGPVQNSEIVVYTTLKVVATG